MARRRDTRASLSWALLISLLINHGLILPGAYLLLMVKPAPPEPDPVMEVALVPQPPEVEPPAPLRPTARVRRLVKKLEQKKPEEKKLEEKKPEEKVQLPEPPSSEMRLKMVEVNNPETERPPDNARFLSDKNRRVEQETRARHTNLERDHPRPEPLSRPNPLREPRPGSDQHRIAEQREQKARKERRPQTPQKASPLMRMRRVDPLEPRAQQKKLADLAPAGDLPAEQAAQPRARRTPNLQLDHRSLDRIDGEQARKQRELARLSPSTPRGRHDKKWQRIRSALENFVPEVRPGNQTALGTRANPFALYVARMHRGIHRLWGYGFLVDLDNKSDSNMMNDMQLWTMIEVVMKPDGQVDKATIVKPSGVLPFDVAALDTIFSAGPYPPTPRAIRSADGKVYLHWRFHRDQRQCGTFGVDPYILTTPPKGPIDGNLAEVGQGHGAPRQVRRLNRPGGAVVTQRTSPPPPHAGAHRPPATAHRPPTGADRFARKVVQGFVDAFRTGDPARMTALCGLPFMAMGRKVATSRTDLQRMFRDLLREARSRDGRMGRLMTPMEARKTLGRLPPGADYGTGMLVGQITLGGIDLTLVLKQAGGSWRISGLNR